MIGVELVAGDGTTTPLDPQKFMTFWEHTRDAGVLIGRGGHSGNVIKKNLPIVILLCKDVVLLQVLRIKPPMCITKEDAAFTVKVIDEALANLEVA